MIAISDIIQTRKDGHGGTIVINRPDRRNALSREIVTAIQSALEDLLMESSVRAVTITGTGETFCSGSDLRQLHSTFAQPDAMEVWHRDATALVDLLEYMLHYPRPLIAAVNGSVLGTGVALMTACDLAIAGKSAELRMPESRLGLSAALSAPLISFRAGIAASTRILLNDESVSADEMKQTGLVHEVVGNDFVWARALEVTGRIAISARESYQAHKQMINETIGEGLVTQLNIGAAAMAAARTTPAAREGVTAFIEKRDPDWNSLIDVD